MDKKKVKQTKFALTLVVIAIGLAVFNIPRVGQVGLLRNILFGLYIWVAAGVSAWISLRHLKEYTLERKITAVAVLLFLLGFGGYHLGPAVLDLVSAQKTVTANASDCKSSVVSNAGSKVYYLEIESVKYSVSKEKYDEFKSLKKKNKTVEITYYPYTKIATETSFSDVAETTK